MTAQDDSLAHDRDAAAQQPSQPEGGYDPTPIPHAPPGFTLKFTIHSAHSLPIADIGTFSSDPYVLSELQTSLPTRHKEDPKLQMRTPTIMRCTDPVWNFEWIVANVPASGFRLRAKVFDEDPANHDDKLGVATVDCDRLSTDWAGLKEQKIKVKKRRGSKRAYTMHAMTVAARKAESMDPWVVISVELLGRTPGKEGGRCYTIGPCWWTKHYSPLLGILANRKEDKDDGAGDLQVDKHGKKIQRYNFQANQLQLRGPTPPELYHRYVEFRPFVKSMYTSSGVKGLLLHKALHHQHDRVYNFSRTTEWGQFDEPCKEMTLKFLDLVHWDRGGRIFTYVITLDALWRFTETGKEFGIDMLSKHTMHSDVNVYIAFSGEFFVRRLKHPNRKTTEEEDEGKRGFSRFFHRHNSNNETHPPDDIGGGPPEDDPPKDPRYYELVIDNDSGTYRPNAKLLPTLKAYLQTQLPGLHIVTLDCQADADKMAEMKQEQRDRKAAEGNTVVYRQVKDDSDSSSISSSDEEDLEDAAREHEARTRDDHVMHALGHQAKEHKTAKVHHFKDLLHRPKKGDSSAGGTSTQGSAE
ncbi:C2 domain-containing protein [Phyllosticta citricarpa]|uniref:C2 domain-containing protein n=1 Tax=Phyllosticta citricarpa TaxID=55181 RepID=A0ABR1LNG2_9PEZI